MHEHNEEVLENSKNISARRRRTELFQSEMFKNRKTYFQLKYDNSGYKQRSFNHAVLYVYGRN
jgi:hypothetical protein